MKRIGERLASGEILVSDGAWGTFLQQKGLKPGECPEIWCIERRAEVLDIAASYVAAGADMIQSNSFGANSFKLAHFGLAAKTAEINEAAAAISREAAGAERHVIASVGPTGKMLLMGDVSEEELYESFKEQVVALERGGADACCMETMSAIDEASVAVKAARENTNLEVIATFTFEKSLQGGYRTMMGVSPQEAAEAMLSAGADIVGSNCGNGMTQMIDIVAEIRAAFPSAPILIHANAGQPIVNADGTCVFPETPDEMAANATKAVRAGAGVVGGCCGTTPDHIRAIARAVRESARAATFATR